MESPGVGANHGLVVSRWQRCALLEEVGTGYLPMAAVLARAVTDPVVAKTEVRLLVRAFPGGGMAEVERVLTRAGITKGRRAGGLAGWQRTVLITALDTQPDQHPGDARSAS
jgi:hypothetical protein